MKKKILMEKSVALILALCLATLVFTFTNSGTAAPADRGEITIVDGDIDNLWLQKTRLDVTYQDHSQMSWAENWDSGDFKLRFNSGHDGDGDINSYSTGNKILAPNTIDWPSGMPTQIMRENVTSWYKVGDTGIWSVAVGDVDNDGQTEIVTGGQYNNGTQMYAQLIIWDGSTLALENATTWHYSGYTQIYSVAIGDVDDDGQNEIVTGGYYTESTDDSGAQLTIWEGSTLTLKESISWRWGEGNSIWSVAVEDVDGDDQTEIVTGGYYNDGTRLCAELTVWDGSTFVLQEFATWYWVGSTRVWSVDVGDVDNDGETEIVTGGTSNNGTHDHAQVAVWEGSTLTLEQISTVHWGQMNNVRSLTVANVDGDEQTEIVTGGYYFDGTQLYAQLAIWEGSTLTLKDSTTWYWRSGTATFSVAVTDMEGDSQKEIVTAGHHNDGKRFYAQLAIREGSTLTLKEFITWYWKNDTDIPSASVEDGGILALFRTAQSTFVYSVAVGDIDGDDRTEIVTGGNYFDGTRGCAQLTVWTTT